MVIYAPHHGEVWINSGDGRCRSHISRDKYITVRCEIEPDTFDGRPFAGERIVRGEKSLYPNFILRQYCPDIRCVR